MHRVDFGVAGASPMGIAYFLASMDLLSGAIGNFEKLLQRGIWSACERLDIDYAVTHPKAKRAAPLPLAIGDNNDIAALGGYWLKPTVVAEGLLATKAKRMHDREIIEVEETDIIRCGEVGMFVPRP